jgi:hypothetical protein
MTGFTGFNNGTLMAANVDFRQTKPVSPQMVSDGQLLIGSAVAPFIRAANLTSTGGSITITNGAGTINLEASSSGTVTGITGDSGGTATGPIITITGGTSGAVFTRSGNTITESFNFLNMAASSSTTGYLAVGGNKVLTIFGSNQNIFAGVTSGNTTLTGANDTGLGNSTLSSLTSGSSNTAIGQSSLNLLSSGSNNIGLGVGSGAFLLTGSTNTLIGQAAGQNYTSSESNNIILGASTGTAGESNALRIGIQGSGSGAQNKCFIAGIAGVTVANTTIVTQNSSTNQMGTIPYSQQGTFTPTIAFGGASVGVVYVNQVGTYNQIGNMVFFRVFLNISSKGSSTGTITISGFPINFLDATQETVVAEYVGITRATYTTLSLQPTGATNSCNLKVSSLTGVGVVLLSNSDIANSTYIVAQGFYAIS